MRQLGNAVPVGLAEVIAKDVRKHLDNLVSLLQNSGFKRV
jgi:site-specific DNA-cytosine methylase